MNNDIQNQKKKLIDTFLKIQSKSKRKFNHRKRKRRISTDLGQNGFCERKKSSSGEEQKGKHKLTVSSEPRQKIMFFKQHKAITFLIAFFYTLSVKISQHSVYSAL
ncbi:hypothetical protein [Flavobacterium procerum]|uniref:hypothetical protein n=1 Tax=Flavobacterium procerum TaxID=1455569 RepID=UPI0036D38D25